MVELEPVMATKNGRPRLDRFVVKTETFTRNTDDGEVEVTAPVIGLCTQSAITLWGAINTLNEQEGPMVELPIQITRRGTRQDTRFDIIPYLEKEVDLSPILTYLDGISYLTEEDREKLGLAIDAEEGEIAKTQAVADFILDKRLEELADKERYEELVGPLKLEDLPKNSWNKKPNRGGTSSRRPVRAAAEAEEPAEPELAKSEGFQRLKARLEAEQ